MCDSSLREHYYTEQLSDRNRFGKKCKNNTIRNFPPFVCVCGGGGGGKKNTYIGSIRSGFIGRATFTRISPNNRNKLNKNSQNYFHCKAADNSAASSSSQAMEIYYRKTMIAAHKEDTTYCMVFFQCCGSGSGAFLTPGSGIRNRFFPDPGSRIPDPKTIFLRA